MKASLLQGSVCICHQACAEHGHVHAVSRHYVDI